MVGTGGCRGGGVGTKGAKGYPLCVGIAAAEPPGGQEARAEIAEGSVVGATEPVGGASGASGAGIAREL